MNIRVHARARCEVRIRKISLSNGDRIVKNPCGVAKTNNSCPPSCASPAALKKKEVCVRVRERERASERKRVRKKGRIPGRNDACDFYSVRKKQKGLSKGDQRSPNVVKFAKNTNKEDCWRIQSKRGKVALRSKGGS